MQTPQLETLIEDIKLAFQHLYGEKLVHLILYGSQARGDAEKYSDVDILVVLKDGFQRENEKQRTGPLMAMLSLKYNTVVSRLFISEKDFQTQNTPLLLNIRREGKYLQ